MGQGEERTESATPRRRDEARKRGQVAKSNDLASIAVLLGLLMALRGIGGTAGHILQGYFNGVFGHLDQATLSPSLAMQQGGQAFVTLAKAVGPLVMLAMGLGMAANVAQTGPVWAVQGLKPDFNRLNPLTGLTRFVSPRSLVELFKSLYKIGLVGWIAYTTLRGAYPELLTMARLDVGQAALLIVDVVFRMALRVASAMLVLAAVDYGYQRWQHEKSLRMTKEEVRQEHKQTDGNPQLKSRIRARQRAIAKKRMMSDVPTADVVVTNPTHFAVALKYEANKMGAPRVVAKGQDVLAFKIREIAQANDVPIVENVALARALYKQVEIGREVPGDLYEAVAEVLAFVYQINAKRRARAGFATL